MTRKRTRRVVAGTAAALLLASAGCSGQDTPAPTAGGATTPTGAPSAAATPNPPATPTAAAKFATLTGQSTRLTLNQGFLDALRALGVTIEPLGGAQAQTNGGATTFAFPVTGGQVTVDPAGTERLAGTVAHRGGLRLSALGRSVIIEDLRLDAGRGLLTARVAGQRVPLLPVDAADARIARQDDQLVITHDAVALSSDSAAELARQLGLPALPNVELGQLQTTLTGSS